MNKRSILLFFVVLAVIPLRGLNPPVDSEPFPSKKQPQPSQQATTLPTPSATTVLKQDVLTILKNLGLEYLWHYSSTIAHELGHALTEKLLTGSKINIHIGVYPWEKPSDEFQNPYGIKFHSINPKKGFSSSPGKRTKAQAFFILAAGEGTALAYTYLFLSGIAGYHKYQECNNVRQAWWYGIKHALTPFKNIHLNKNLRPSELILHLILIVHILFTQLNCISMGFFPNWSNKSDGTKIWDLFSTPDQTKKTVQNVVTIVRQILKWIIVWQACKAGKKYAQEHYHINKDSLLSRILSY